MLRARGVEFIVLSPESRRVSEPLGALYDGPNSVPGLTRERIFGGLKVYRVR